MATKNSKYLQNREYRAYDAEDAFSYADPTNEDILDLSFIEETDMEYQMGDAYLESVIHSVDGNVYIHAHGSYDDGNFESSVVDSILDSY